MYRKVVISLLVVALFAFTATGKEEEQKDRRLARLRNRPGFFEVEESSHISAAERPQGLLDATAERYARSSHRYRETRSARALKSSKAESTKTGKSDSSPPKTRAKSEKTRQASADVEMSMSMDFRQMEMSMSMVLRQADMSMSMSM